MTQRVLLLASHGIAEYDDVRMFHRLGYDVFCPGGYSNPAQPGETLRPALPEVPYHADLARMCDVQREKHAGQSTDFGIVDWAKADLHPGLVDWADVIVVHHFVEAWIGNQWDRIKGKRVIWRTCGQSNPRLENEMAAYRREGLQIVRYSPAERRGFEPLGVFAGQDALIRFGKDPDDYGPWIGDDAVVGNVTQNLDLRGDHCGLSFIVAATHDLPIKFAGPGSERIGGVGELSYQGMLDYLRHLRGYVYFGTEQASYTLALIEAMLSGVPVISAGPATKAFLPDLFEGHEIAGLWQDDPAEARYDLRNLVEDYKLAAEYSPVVRQRAIDLFSLEVVGPQWLDFLGNPGQAEFAHERLVETAA